VINGLIPLVQSSYGSWLWYHTSLGWTYLRQNEVIKALLYLQKGLEGDDDDLGGTYYQIWSAYTNIGNYKKAEVYGQKAAESFCIGIGTVPNSLMAQGKFRD